MSFFSPSIARGERRNTMEGLLDQSVTSGDWWDHRMSSETSHLGTDSENVLFGDANHFDQICRSYNEW